MAAGVAGFLGVQALAFLHHADPAGRVSPDMGTTLVLLCSQHSSPGSLVILLCVGGCLAQHQAQPGWCCHACAVAASGLR